MLNFEKVKEELEKWAFDYKNNVVPGHSVYKVKWVLPAGLFTIMASEKVISYLFGFDEKGVYVFPADEKWNILDCLLLKWKDIKEFKMKKGLLAEDTMNIVTNEMKVSFKINKVVVRNPWVKENINNLEALNYYKR